ncbi:MAG TPA: LptF/LptG family permease [Sphaerochaeta sp.]|nr:LptF/LptG family permease [Sphaerochaeta sp.]
MAPTGRHTLVYRHTAREYLLSFVVAFLFFFFIFFINQILLLAQKILIKNVDYSSVLILVLLSIPQFLLYTFPFASLSASSMVIGDLGANNELLAMRSSGISLYRVFVPIIAISLLFSATTFVTADVLVPYSAKQYRALYTELMRDLPTIEIRANATNTIGSRSITNRAVDGSTIHDLVMIEQNGARSGQVITAPSAEITLADLASFVYRLDVEEPTILKSESGEGWTLSSADQATVMLNLGSQVASIASALPSQLSTRELREKIRENKATLDEELSRHQQKIDAVAAQLEAARLRGAGERVEDLEESLDDLKAHKPVNFYYLYYRAELSKKYALSAACTILVLITFSLSFLRLKHGRLIGFGLSMLASVLYWYILFFSQMKVFNTAIAVEIWIWLANIILGSLGIIGLVVTRRL